MAPSVGRTRKRQRADTTGADGPIVEPNHSEHRGNHAQLAVEGTLRILDSRLTDLTQAVTYCQSLPANSNISMQQLQSGVAEVARIGMDIQTTSQLIRDSLSSISQEIVNKPHDALVGGGEDDDHDHGTASDDELQSDLNSDDVLHGVTGNMFQGPRGYMLSEPESDEEPAPPRKITSAKDKRHNFAIHKCRCRASGSGAAQFCGKKCSCKRYGGGCSDRCGCAADARCQNPFSSERMKQLLARVFGPFLSPSRPEINPSPCFAAWLANPALDLDAVDHDFLMDYLLPPPVDGKSRGKTRCPSDSTWKAFERGWLDLQGRDKADPERLAMQKKVLLCALIDRAQENTPFEWSFCRDYWEEVGGNIWVHCAACGECNSLGSWHCKVCNTCRDDGRYPCYKCDGISYFYSEDPNTPTLNPAYWDSD